MSAQEYQRYRAEFSRIEREYSALWKESPLNPEKLSALMRELVRLDRVIRAYAA